MPTPLNQLKAAFWAAIKAAQPTEHLADYLPPAPKGRLVVVGAGKAAAAMAQAVETHYQDTALSGIVITRCGHALPTQHIEVVEAAHPVPDAAGVTATKRILELCQSLNEDDLLLCLISGGGSALLCAPAGINLQQTIQLTNLLLNSGATIQEMNVVRKHLSRVKGGRLAAAAFPARVLTLVVSDVVGDELSSIASGPSVPDPSTYGEARKILNHYEIQMPEVMGWLERGLRGKLAETPKAGHPAFARTQTHIIASAQHSLKAAQTYFESQGISAHILSDSVTGEAREVAKVHAALVKQIHRHAEPFQPPCVLLSGGETTVTVRASGHGKGGRNAEFALSLVCELNALEGVHALAADTDGIDGSEDNAGTFVTPDIFANITLSEARAYLHANDSYSFFKRANSLFITGPTNTNVNDLRMIFIED